MEEGGCKTTRANKYQSRIRIVEDGMESDPEHVLLKLETLGIFQDVFSPVMLYICGLVPLYPYFQ